ncbi:metallophosphoesterase [Paenibacillus polymyxa]|uniref:metallophosphoesterase n=2 Tax=Paenibacillus polymyxa TaxID=1406 RepID=UPI000F4E7A2F|nr:metallophosphoesterase [Paenibacillus polymyxa]RPE06769.1 NACHT domain-containing protein [Paenibacillus polymyxa]
MLRIVHLSDFHYSDSTKRDFELYCLKPLVEDLKVINSKRKIDLIIFSGDLVDKGGGSFNGDLEIAFLTFEENVMAPILEALELPKERFIIVPGNHDVDQKADDIIDEAGLKHTLTSIEAVNDYIDSNVLLKGSRRIEKYKEFEKYLYNNTTHITSNFVSTFKFSIDGLNVGISGFNSAWRCRDSKTDKGAILLGERQVANATEALADCDLKIAVIHHPLDWLAPFEKIQVENMIQRAYTMMFCGHVHEGGSHYSTNMYGGNLFVSAAPANWSASIRTNTPNFSNGYAYIDYNLSNITVYNRSYFHLKECFNPNIYIGDEEGKVIYNLPSQPLINSLIKKKELCETIITERISQIDEHLLTFRANTLAPKKVDELFVMPRLTHQQSKDNEEVYNLDQLCSSNENILMLGAKESGKTILLDKLLVEFTQNIMKYNKIPVYINLEKRINRYETEIARYLNVKIHEVEELLNNQDVVLLLDDLSSSHKSISKLSMLEKLIEKHPNIRVIVTATSFVSSDLPVEFRDFPLLSSFKLLQINLFKSNQIRGLIKKWFSTNPNYKSDESLEDIVNIFNKLDIPRTPLAVSMFLCSIELQPNYKPTNNAALLENFIEILFDKHDPQEMYLEMFNYKNKERLLAEISHKMFKDNNVDYRIKRVDLINFIESYLNTRRFSYKADDILKDLEKVGIFIEDIEDSCYFLKFRFNCFFSYFLMKNMEFLPEFKDYILSEDNFLHFVDEIDYYTGIKRDEETILTLITERMTKMFSEVIEQTNHVLSHDEIFHSNNQLVSNLSDDLLTNIPRSEMPSTESIDEMHDTKMELAASFQQHGNKRIDEEFSDYKKLELSWTLVARVLKNTEETINGKLKAEVYQKIIKYSATYITLARILIEENLKQNMGSHSVGDEYTLFLDYLPTGLQLVLFNLVSSSKLSMVMEEDLKEKLNFVSEYSELEIFLSLLNFLDLNNFEGISYVREFLKIYKRNYIGDNMSLKLVYMYRIKPQNSTQEKELLSLLGELKTRHLKPFEKNQIKSRIIQGLKDDKAQRIRKGELDEEGIA